MAHKAMGCELCAEVGGKLLWKDGACRIVRVEEHGYPGFCRVVWNSHVREMTDLTAAQRAHLMHVVFALEMVLRECLRPHKMNLASLGNVTPHVHWHVIPRFEDDPHFPQPIWALPHRPVRHSATDELDVRLAEALVSALG